MYATVKEKRWVEFKGEVDSTSIPGKSVQQNNSYVIIFRHSIIGPFITHIVLKL